MMPIDPHRHLDDETLNAVLDGEATEEEMALGAECAECSARLARLRLVARAVAGPTPTPDAARRQSAVDAALRAGDPGIAPPTALASRPRWRVSPGWAAAAAVVVAGALAVPLVDGLGGSDQGEDLATTAGEAEDSSSGDESPADDEAAGGSAALQPSAPDRNLGAIDLSGLDELAVALERDLSAPAPVAAPDSGRPEAQEDRRSERFTAAEQPCEASARQRDPTLGPLAYSAQASLDGQSAVVLAFAVTTPGGPSTIRLLVLAADDCSELGSASS